MHVSKVVIAALLSFGLATGCGERTPDEATADGGPGNEGGKEGVALKVNALSTDVIVGEPPLASEGSGLSGSIIITDTESQHVDDATVTVNGVTIPYAGSGGEYRIADAEIPNAGPGMKITVEASRPGSESASVSFNCPAAVTLTEPAEGTAVSEGASVKFAWSGKIDYDNDLFDPHVEVRNYAASLNSFEIVMSTAKYRAEATGTETTVVAPELRGEAHGWMGSLIIPGDLVADSDHRNTGFCNLVVRRRIDQVAQQ